MEYFIIISIIAWLFILKPKDETKEECSMHVWVRHDQPDDPNLQYLQCSRCQTIPGHDKDEKV